MDKLVNAILEVSKEARQIRECTAKISEMHDNFIRLKLDIEKEKEGRRRLEQILSDARTGELLNVSRKIFETHDRIRAWTICVCMIFALSVVFFFFVAAEVRGISPLQYLRGAPSHEQKIAIFEELTGESLQNMESFKRKLKYIKRLDPDQRDIMTSYIFGEYIGILEKQKAPDTGKDCFAIKKLYRDSYYEKNK